jgi:hypothetical protein
MPCTCGWSTPIRQDGDALVTPVLKMAGGLAEDELDSYEEPSHIHIPRPSRVAAQNA